MPAWESPSSGACASSRRKIAGSSRSSPTSPWTSRCSRRCCKKRCEARAPTRDRVRADRRVSRERAAGLYRRRLPPGDVLLPRPATRRDTPADAVAGAGGGPAAVRLSTLARLVTPGGLADQREKDVPVVPRGGARGASEAATQAGESAAGRPDAAESTE